MRLYIHEIGYQKAYGYMNSYFCLFQNPQDHWKYKITEVQLPDRVWEQNKIYINDPSQRRKGRKLQKQLSFLAGRQGRWNDTI